MKKTSNTNSRTALFLFPGQGSQYSGMGVDLLEKYPKLRDFYDIANNILGYDILEIILNNDSDKLDQTLYTQPAIFIDSMVKETLLLANNIFPHAVAGHSLGEYSALVSCNVLNFEDALKIIKVRAYEMQNAGNKSPGKMLAIMGASEQQIKDICSRGEVLVAANYKDASLEYDTSKPTMIPKRMINIDKAKDKLNWSPRISIKEGIEKTVGWYKKTYKNKSPEDLL